MAVDKQMSVIADLIEQVQDAVESEKNAGKGRLRPCICVAIEEPITWTKLFEFDANSLFSDPLFYVEQVLRQKLWRFVNIPDDTPITMDIPTSLGMYPEYTFIGMHLDYTPGGVPIIQEDHPLSRDADLSLLLPVDYGTSGWMPRALGWHEAIKDIVGARAEVPFGVTWWRGCLDLAIQLRGYENFIYDTMENPEFIHGLMQYLVRERNRWHHANCMHFSQPLTPTSIGDDWINIPFITPDIFAEFVLPCYLELEAHHGGIAGIHSCGNQAPVQQYLLQLCSLDVFEVSPWTNLKQTVINVPAEKRLNIGIHPNEVLLSTPSETRDNMTYIRETCQGRQYTIGTSGLTPLDADHAGFINRIQQWLTTAKETLWQ